MTWWVKFSGLLISLLVIIYVSLTNWPLIEQNTQEIKFGLPRVKKGVTLAGKEVGNLNQIELIQVISSLAGELGTAPKPAFRYQNQIQSGISGKELNVTKTLVKTLTAEGGEDIKPVYESVAPLIEKEHLITEKIVEFSTGRQGVVAGHFTTYLKNNQANRRTNIKLALQELNGYTLQAGEQFSFNQVLGEPNRKAGYKPAPVIINGSFKPRVGGGICQVSSTLYNVVKRAGLKVLERHAHSQPVAYVAQGRDATIYPGQKDFRFQNNTSCQFRLKGELIGKYVAIYFLKLKPKKLKLESRG